jgi:hypothetical protein
MTLGVVHTASIVQGTSIPEAANDNGYSEHQAGTDDSQPHCHYLSATLHRLQDMHKMLLQDDIILWFKSSEVSAD